MNERAGIGSKAEQRIRALLEDTASARGEAFFPALVKGLARVLGTRFASLSVVRGEDELETLAFWDGESVSRGTRYRMSGTPCADAVGGEFCVFRDRVQEAFPEDGMLAELGIRSYVGVVILAADGQVLGVLSAMHDGPLPPAADDAALMRSSAARAASELVQMRFSAALEASEALTRGILESMRDAIVVVRPDDTVAFHNGAACELFRTDPLWLSGAALGDLLPALDGAAAEIGNGDPQSAFDGGASLEIEAHGPDGAAVPVAVTIGSFELAGERLRTVVLRNVERRRREEQRLRGYARALERANADLERARRKAEQAAAAKTEFLANMSHEIRTPMTAILGFTDILLEDGAPDAGERVDALKTIRRNGAYLLEILNDILDFSKIEANRLEIEEVPCAPGRIFGDVTELMRPRAQDKGVQLRLELEGPIPERLVSDPVRLRQILLNLVGNAVKFTPAGHVRVIARYDEPDRTLEFDVEDTGIGIAEGVLLEIFEPFRQGDSSMTRRFGGTGLGLAITKRLVERLGGAITATSTAGRGSTFRVRLPAHPVGSGNGASEVAESDTPSTGRMRAALDNLRSSGRILMVEDGPDNQRVIRHLLEKAGYKVTIAENGQVGVELALNALEEGTPYSVILMDVQMPVLDGYEATRRLRESGYTAPIIALTAHALPSERQRCIEAGCDAFATKPIERVVLLETIARHLAKPPEGPIDG
jgi:signal transduction histidine kinase/CheY-like chemotaxis protein